MGSRGSDNGLQTCLVSLAYDDDLRLLPSIFAQSATQSCCATTAELGIVN
jgi:hypothetical protein